MNSYLSIILDLYPPASPFGLYLRQAGGAFFKPVIRARRDIVYFQKSGYSCLVIRNSEIADKSKQKEHYKR